MVILSLIIIIGLAFRRDWAREAGAAFLDRFTENGQANVALSYSPENAAARAMYLSIGFAETGEMEDDEIVARYRRG